jgi:hypothetical protein
LNRHGLAHSERESAYDVIAWHVTEGRFKVIFAAVLCRT